jgi:tetratricopeptide (TPR) repeat protein
LSRGFSGGAIMRFSIVLSLPLIFVCAGAANAASQQDWDDCKQTSDRDRTIAGCTRVVQDQSESASNRAIAQRNRGVAYDMLGAQDRALADFEEAIKLDRNYAPAHLSRGIMYGKKGDYDRAIAEYSEAMRIDPKYAVAYSRRGNAYYAKKDYDRAIADYNEAIKLDPNVAVLYLIRGNAYSGKRNYDRAIADYDQAIKLDPNNADFRKSRDNAREAKRAATTPEKPREPQHYLLNSTPVAFEVIDNGKTVCSLAPRQSCWWPAPAGQHAIELRRPDGKTIRKSVSISGYSGVLHTVICPKDFGTSERSDAPVCN